ncbi:hypothetical protein L1857_20220 [Amycolatopsis thermalba]|uniref:Uncharacterized protein n=1 Tax=Amycolatopsis thermalba TaxID=944492 RepID=A0ABY4NY97_9PSEU|nr:MULTISPECIES: hypothetical protein [Amycolatopsis]UQS24973.1 hypothetical protein L1857_20220 [Amycolatopsis thermalba]
MDENARLNVVVFQVNGDEDDLLRAAAPAQAEDAIRQAWRQVQRERQVQPPDITRVHSVWQPSRVDRIFLAATFRGAEITHDFDRPADGDWDTAFEAAREENTKVQLESLRDAFVRAESEGEWLPILHTYDGPLKLYYSLPLVDDRLHLGFARATATPEGRVGMSHLLRNQADALSEDEFHELIDEAVGNLRRGLIVKVAPDPDKGPLVILERGDNSLCAASAVVMDDFAETIGAHVGEDQLLAALVSPDHIYVAGVSSGWAPELTEWVRTSPDTSGDLVPTLLRVDSHGIREIIAERPTGRVPASTSV